MRLITLFTLMLVPFAFAEGERNLEQAKKLNELKIQRFFKKMEARADLDAATKAKIAKLRPGALVGGEYGCMHQALLIIEPDYKKADALLLGERFAAAADLYRKLATSDDEYLKAYATFRFGLAEMSREQFEGAADAFQTVLNEWGRYVGCQTECAFYIAVCYGQMREKEKAIVAATRFLEDYPDAPERYKAAMAQMKNELVQEWESPLYDLAGKMNRVGREIEKGETNVGSGGAPRGNRQSSSPANRSQASPGASRVGDLRGKPRTKAGEKWGEMRDKERDEVLQALKEKFPGRYRELQEQYDRAVAEGKRVTESSGDNRGEK